MGMRRRIANYDPALGVEGTQILITIAALVIAWSVLIMLYNLVSSARSAELAPKIHENRVHPNGSLPHRYLNSTLTVPSKSSATL